MRDQKLFLSFLLAKAVLEIFPDTQLICGTADEIGFSYSFQFVKSVSKLFNQDLLIQIEDCMRGLIATKPPLKKIEMMKQVAEQFFKSNHQFQKAKLVSEFPYNVVPLIQAEHFYDLLSEDFSISYEEKFHFKLINYEINDDNILINGIAFNSKEELKNFLKKYEPYKKIDFQKLAQELKIFYQKKNHFCFLLPKGNYLLNFLKVFWQVKVKEMGYEIIQDLSGQGSFETIQALAKDYYKGVEPLQLAQICHLNEACRFSFFSSPQQTKDKEVLFCSKSNLKQQLISSLHFIEKTIKIFGFKYRLDVTQTKKEKKNIKELKFHFENEIPKDLFFEGCFQFYLYDSLERGHKGPYLEAFEKENGSIICLSLFSSFEGFLALLIEKYAGEFPFWLAPEQVRVIPTEEKYINHAKKIVEKIKQSKIRAFFDLNFELNLAKRVYEATKEKVPYLILLGEKEINKNPNQNWITVRSLNYKEQSIELEQWLKLLELENKQFEN